MFLPPNKISILASTSTLKSPLSPRPNLMPFPSRETASATKCHQQLWCHQPIWPSPKTNHAFLSHLAGYVFWLLYCTFILATNCFKKLKHNSKLFSFYVSSRLLNGHSSFDRKYNDSGTLSLWVFQWIDLVADNPVQVEFIASNDSWPGSK